MRAMQSCIQSGKGALGDVPLHAGGGLEAGIVQSV